MTSVDVRSPWRGVNTGAMLAIVFAVVQRISCTVKGYQCPRKIQSNVKRMTLVMSRSKICCFGVICTLMVAVTSVRAEEVEALEARIATLESELVALRSIVEALLPPSGDNAVLPTPEQVVAVNEPQRPPRSSGPGEGFSYQGFIQLDTLLSDYSDGRPNGSAIEDFLIPSDIPVAADGASGFRSTNMSAKTTRFAFATDHLTSAGRVSSLLELDFALSSQGNERISNSWSSRLRHAYVDWQLSEQNSLLAGQTWTTFMRAEARPALWDMTGSVGQSFNRQPLIRWRHNRWSLAAENPATRLEGVPYEQEQRAVPDLVVRYDGETGALGWTVAGLLRQLNYREERQGEATREDEVMGYALSFAGNWQTGANDFRFMLNYGDALGRYMGLNAFNDGVVTADGSIRTFDQFGGLISWSRRFSPRWQAGVALSGAWADVPGEDVYDAAGLMPESYATGHFNLWYRPTPSLALGSEYIRAVKRLEDGDSGSLDRLMLSVRYNLK